MIDFHTHILPALDDGAVSIDESIAMARALASFGYKTVCCTPHCMKGYYDLTPQKVREATLMLQADLDNADIQLELWPGMEYLLDECFVEYAEDLLPLGKTKLVLCEAPPQAHYRYVQEGLGLILEKGYVPLIAHPERTPFFYELLTSRGEGETKQAVSASRTEERPQSSQSFFKRILTFASRTSRPVSRPEKPTPFALPEGVLFHANIGSFSSYYGVDVQRKAYDLLKAGTYAAMASDLHDSRSCPQVLVQDKFGTNPLLNKLAAFDGSAAALFEVGIGDGLPGEQGELF